MHCMVGGGDQIYCDAITREPELQGMFTLLDRREMLMSGWINAPDRESKIGFSLTDEMVRVPLIDVSKS